jgi:hypothetical protein
MAIYRVTTFGHMQTGEQWNTTWHVQAVTGLGATIAATAADAVTEAWTGTSSPAGKLEDYYPASFGVDGVRVEELDGAGRHNVTQSIESLALVGVSTDELLPPNVAVAVSLRTDLPTKGGHGRNFLPGPVVTTVVNQLLDTAVQTALKNAWLRALNWMLDHAAPVGIFHRETVEWDQVVSVDVGDVFDEMTTRRNQLDEVRVRSNLS